MLRSRLVCAGFFFLALGCLSLLAQQASSGTVTGQVTDQQGAAIPGAVVVLTNTATNGAQPTTTNNAGRYVFANVQPGTYSVDVKKTGFKEAIVKNQTVALGKPLTINVPMQVGAATQTVEVTASGAELQTMNATVGTSVSTDAIMKLPSIGRDANALTLLQPNTETDGSIAGAQDDQNTYTLDGGSNSNDMDGSSADYTPSAGYVAQNHGDTPPSGVMPTPSASVQTFTVGVNNQSADINSAAGGSISMETKRGTDAVHGSAYEYYLGSKLGANTWLNNFNGLPRAISHQNRFGAALGGEILPDFLGGKTYLFGNYEGRRYPNYATYTHLVPTASLRSGVVATQQADGSYLYTNLNPYTVTVPENTGAGVYASTTVAPGVCSGYAGGATGPCDPKSLGLNPVTAAIWNNYMPAPNGPAASLGGDGGYNTANFNSTVNNSIVSNFFVARLDHDFGAKNHFTSTFHFYSYNPITSSQVDIGGALPGDTLGVPAATSVRPQLPAMFTAQLTTSLTANTTNNLHYSYLRNFWQWSGPVTTPQPMPASVTLPNGAAVPLTALAGTMELSGETANGLQPYNVNTQSTRTRYWDGVGNTIADDVNMIHGNHVFSFGGKYTHQFDQHQRNDNGGNIDVTTAYLAGGNGNSNLINPYLPVGYTGTPSNFNTYYDAVLGIVNQSQTMYTRVGQNLTLQAQGTPLEEQSEIPLYNVYFSDAWHVRPSLTFTYGTGYTVEMPPFELDGRQVEAVDESGNQISAPDYLAATERAALGGQVYNPTVGFATVGNIGAGLKYPYRTFYGGLSPRISLAWNPNMSGGWLGALFGGNKTVVRGGWSRIYGRLNGVDLVLVPLLGTGLAQPIACQAPLPGNTCAGVGGATPANAFRIGPTANGDNGMSVGLGAPPSTNLPQPYYPGMIQNGVVNPGAGSNDSLDPDFKPDRSDEFDLTIQRQFTPAFSTEIGYTGRILRNEYQSIDLDSVPYMLSSGGQQFQNAFSQMAQQMMAGSAISPQPFFETALGGPSSAFCTGYSSCTAAVAAVYGPHSAATGVGNNTLLPTQGFDVYNLWSQMQSLSSWALGRTTMDAPTTCTTPGVGACPASGVVSSSGQMGALFQETADGYGNYNSLFWTVSMRNFHNLTAISNLTWSRSLGTGDVDQATSEYTVADPFNLHAMYGPQFDDMPLNYNLYFIYEPGSKTQHGLMGHLLNGWSFAPVLTWHRIGGTFGTNNSGWEEVGNGQQCDAFGEGNCSFETTDELAVKTTGYTGGTTFIYGSNNPTQTGSGSNAANGGTGVNRFGSNAAGIAGEFRPIVLGLDTTATSGNIPGVSVTNVDFSLTKNLAISERFSTQLNAQATNVFNHFAPFDSGDSIYGPNLPSFGNLTENYLLPRTVEVGLAVSW